MQSLLRGNYYTTATFVIMNNASYRTIKLKLGLPLRYLGNAEDAIKKRIDGLVSHYISGVDGYLTKWRNLNILDDKATIIDDQPYVFIRVSFEGNIFTPAEGKIIKGKVEKITKSYLIVRALDAFAVSITIPEEFKDSNIMKSIMLDSEIYFKMKGRSKGMLDKECIELSECKVDETGEDVYAYANHFDY